MKVKEIMELFQKMIETDPQAENYEFLIYEPECDGCVELAITDFEIGNYEDGVFNYGEYNETDFTENQFPKNSIAIIF